MYILKRRKKSSRYRLIYLYVCENIFNGEFLGISIIEIGRHHVINLIEEDGMDGIPFSVSDPICINTRLCPEETVLSQRANGDSKEVQTNP